MWHPYTSVIFFLTAVSCDFLPDIPVIIRNDKSNLVLDASVHQVKLQRFTGLPSQLWIVRSAVAGAHTIINKGNDLALATDGEKDNEGDNVVTTKVTGLSNDQWFISSDGTIVNALGSRFAMGVAEKENIAGADLKLFSIKKDMGEEPSLIQNKGNELVLDGTEHVVTLQPAEKYRDLQLWVLESAQNGKHFIINKASRLAMDIDPEAKEGDKIVTNKLNGTETQQWYINYDGTIVNSNYTDLVLDVYGGLKIDFDEVFTLGKLSLSPRNKDVFSQKFSLSYMYNLI